MFSDLLVGCVCGEISELKNSTGRRRRSANRPLKLDRSLGYLCTHNLPPAHRQREFILWFNQEFKQILIVSYHINKEAPGSWSLLAGVEFSESRGKARFACFAEALRPGKLRVIVIVISSAYGLVLIFVVQFFKLMRTLKFLYFYVRIYRNSIYKQRSFGVVFFLSLMFKLGQVHANPTVGSVLYMRVLNFKTYLRR